jgi:hydroxylamine reductase
LPGCATDKGVCGKDEATADLQDVLIYVLKGIGQYSARLHKLGKGDAEADSFAMFALFTTLTNVNFNRNRFVDLIQEAVKTRNRVRDAYLAAAPGAVILGGPAAFEPAQTLLEMLSGAKIASVRKGVEQVGEDIIGLRELVLYGLKGVAAYAHHAEVLGKIDADVHAGVAHALEFLAGEPANVDELLAEALALGTLNYKVMGILYAANSGAFGTPVPTSVRTTPIAGKALLVSGHDLRDLHDILEATKGTGVQVYTHGELLPAHSYPKLKEYSHLAGNFGTAWQSQQTEFAQFPGPVVMTSNCLIEPQASYRNRIFTTGPTGWQGVRHIENHDYSIVVQAAKAMPGFTATVAPEKTVLIGFGHDAVLGVAAKVIAGVKSGAIKHFYLIGGCDGAAPGRNYYTDFAEQTPNDTVMLTLGCNKYRINHRDYGTIDGIPRLLDIGQCNDSYSAVQIALALADAFQCGVNELPLSLIVSWFEQKAVAVLLTLLALGVKNIRLGPSIPGFLTPALVNVLVEKFALKPITTAEADIAASLAV